jgi:hypothetical protein
MNMIHLPVKAILLLLLCASFSWAQRPDDSRIRQDIRHAMRQGVQVLGQTIKVSSELSCTIAPDKQLRRRHKMSEMVAMKKRLAGGTRPPIERRGMKEKHRRELERPGFRPSERLTPTLPPGLQSLVEHSQNLRVICARLAAALARDDAAGERHRLILVEELRAKSSRKSRHSLASVVDILCAVPDLEGKASIKQLRTLQPILRKESKNALRAVNLGFSQLFGASAKARDKLKSFARRTYEPMRARARKSMASKSRHGRPQQPRGRIRIPASRSRGLLSNIMNNIADNLQEDFDKGCQYGETAANVIGYASGAQGAIKHLAGNATLKGAGKVAGDLVVDHFNPLDPSSAIGHYAGGVIGMVGGAIGTSAGWICGTIESHLANRRGARRSGGGGKTRDEAGKDEEIDLFG